MIVSSEKFARILKALKQHAAQDRETEYIEKNIFWYRNANNNADIRVEISSKLFRGGEYSAIDITCYPDNHNQRATTKAYYTKEM